MMLLSDMPVASMQAHAQAQSLAKLDIDFDNAERGLGFGAREAMVVTGAGAEVGAGVAAVMALTNAK